MTHVGKKCKRGAVPIKVEGKIAKSPKSLKATPSMGYPVYRYQNQHAPRNSNPDELLQWIVSGGDQKFAAHESQVPWAHDSCLREADETRASNRDTNHMDDDHQSAAGTEDHEAAAQSEAVRLPAVDRAFIGMHEVLALGVPGLVNYQRAQMALSSVLSQAPFNQFGMQVNVDDNTLSERTPDGGPSLVQKILTLESRSSVKKGQWVPRPCQYFSREQWKKLGIIPNHPHSGSPLALKITRFEREKVSVIGVMWNRVAGDAHTVLSLLREWSNHFDTAHRTEAHRFLSRSELCLRESDLMVGEHFLNTEGCDDETYSLSPATPSSLSSDASDAAGFPLPLIPAEDVDELMDQDDDDGCGDVSFVEYRVSAEGLAKWKAEKQLEDVADDVAVIGVCCAGILGDAPEEAAAHPDSGRCEALRLTTSSNIRGRCSQVAGNLVGNAVAFHGMELKNAAGELCEEAALRTVRQYHESLEEFLGSGDQLFDQTMGRLARAMSRGEDEELRLWPSFMQMASDRQRVLIESWCGIEVFETQPSGWDFGTGKEVSHLGYPDYGCPRGLRVMPNFRSGKDLAVLVGMTGREVNRLEEFVKRMELPMKLVKQ